MLRTRFRILLVLIGLIASVWTSRPILAQGHPCAGRCNYCVDGVCIPRRKTYGYYEPHWRKWPVGPPEVCIPAQPIPSSSPLTSDVEPPAIEDEADTLPRFPHLRPRAGSLEPEAQVEPELPTDPFGDDPISGDLPNLDEAETDSAEPEIDDFSRGSLPGTVRPTSYSTIKHSRGCPDNPLRGGVRPPIRPTATLARLPSSQPSRQLGAPFPTQPPKLAVPPTARRTSQPASSGKNPLRG